MTLCTPGYLREIADNDFDRSGQAVRDALRDAADEIERLTRCHHIVTTQAGYYKPELPDFTKVDIHLGVLRAAARCAGTAPWEFAVDQQGRDAAK